MKPIVTVQDCMFCMIELEKMLQSSCRIRSCSFDFMCLDWIQGYYIWWTRGG